MCSLFHFSRGYKALSIYSLLYTILSQSGTYSCQINYVAFEFIHIVVDIEKRFCVLFTDEFELRMVIGHDESSTWMKCLVDHIHDCHPDPVFTLKSISRLKVRFFIFLIFFSELLCSSAACMLESRDKIWGN